MVYYNFVHVCSLFVCSSVFLLVRPLGVCRSIHYFVFMC